MRYETTDELEHFNFSEAYIGDVQITSGFFHMVLDNVTILPENSCNRDIRQMRANNLVLIIQDFSIVSVIEEGYKVYDANGKLMKSCEDTVIAEEAWIEAVKGLTDGIIYSLEKQGDAYVFSIDAANERTYALRVKGSHDVEEWDRFLNKDEG